MERRDGGLGGGVGQVRRPRIAGGHKPLPPELTPPPIAPPNGEATPAFGAPLFADAEINRHLDASLDESLFEPELLDPTPLPPPAEAKDGALLPDLELPSHPPPLRSAQRLSPLSARIAAPPKRTSMAGGWPETLAAAALGGILGYQLSQLLSSLF